MKVRQARRMRALQEGPLREAAASTVQAFLGGHVSRLSTSTSMHPAFCTAQRVLDLLFPG